MRRSESLLLVMYVCLLAFFPAEGRRLKGTTVKDFLNEILAHNPSWESHLHIAESQLQWFTSDSETQTFILEIPIGDVPALASYVPALANQRWVTSDSETERFILEIPVDGVPALPDVNGS
jgi:hypothetical protein